jgi:predicted lysophospholipase L1 biosynthesis ABC-type transport system permease subunit
LRELRNGGESNTRSRNEECSAGQYPSEDVDFRSNEIGIRIALGARLSHLLKTILGQFLGPVALGVLLRATAAAALSQLLRHVLYGVSNLDPLSYSAAIGLLVAIAVIAALVPARRALRIDPMRALRHEHKIPLSARPLRTGITTASDAGIVSLAAHAKSSVRPSC